MRGFRAKSVVSLVLILASDGFALVDQQYVPASTNLVSSLGGGNISDLAQTFTVGTAGILTGIDLWIDRGPAVTLPLLMDIRRTLSGVPTVSDSGADVLASDVILADFFPIRPLEVGSPPATLLHFPLGAQSFPVAVGDVLAIVLRSDDPAPPEVPKYQWHGQNPGAYPRGISYSRHRDFSWLAQSWEYVFRTHVTPIPEPSALFLAFLAAGVLAWRRHDTNR